MKIVAELIRLFATSSAAGTAIRGGYTYNSQLEFKANDLGYCAVYEKELQRVWPITEEDRKAKIGEFGEEHGFRLAYYKQGHCAIFLKDSTGRDIIARENRRDGYSNRNQVEYPFGYGGDSPALGWRA
jgi:hypothetical protein